MRYLMLFTIGFSAGAALGAYAFSGNPVLCLLAAAIFIPLAIAGACIRKQGTHVAAMCLAGAVIGCVWYWGYDSICLSGARAVDGKTVNAQIQVTDYSVDTDFGVRANGKIKLGNRSYRVCVYMNEDTSLSPGDRVNGAFRLSSTLSSGEQGTYFRSEGVFLLAYSRGESEIIPGNGNALRYLPARMRHGSLAIIDRVFPEDTRGFAAALLLGEDSGLTYMGNTALKLSGIRHVVAVSGQHLVILMAAVLFLTGKRRKIACYLSIPVSILFAAMAGFTPSILRACIMQLILTAAFLFRREYDPPTSVAAAVLVMVMSNPLAITAVSLQLSVASIVGIFLFSKPLYMRMHSWYFFQKIPVNSLAGRLLFWILGTTSVTIAAMSLTTPLSAVYFKTVSLVGVITNLVTLWLITVVFYGVIAAVVLGILWQSAGMLAGKVFSLAIRFVLWAADGLSQFSVGCLYLRNPYMVLAAMLVYGVFLLCLSTKRIRLSMGCLLITAVLAAAFMLSWVTPMTDEYRIVVLDVGQGQCIILHSRQRTYMMDCGGSHAPSVADTAAETLYSMGIDRLDGLIITHYDHDHVSAVPYLLQRIRVDTMILPEEPGNPYAQTLTQQFQGEFLTLTQDRVAAWNHNRLTVFAGNGGEYGNEMSLCVLFQSKNCDILITGDRPVDLEEALVEHTALPKLEYLVAGHHGSKDSTGDRLLTVTQPETVLISVGEDNQYGHPQSELLRRLKEFGCRVRRTDLEGTIIIRG